MRLYTRLNTICFLAGAFFLLLTAYLWRGVFMPAAVQKEVQDIPVVQYTDVKKEPVVPLATTHETSSEATTSGAQKDASHEQSIAALPKKMNLDVPFTSQAPEGNWDQPWQDACEEAAVLMMDAYYKEYSLSPLFAKDEMTKMIEWETSVQSWGRSIEIEKVQKLFAWYAGASAVTTKIVENPTVEQIKTFIAAGHPVLVVADGKVLPNPHFKNGGPVYHALVIRGYTESTFITNDPGTKFGENFTYKYDELMNSIRDWNQGDVKTGRRVILVAK